MNSFDLAKEICLALERAEKESKNNSYLLTMNTIKRIKLLDRLLKNTNSKIEFNRATNSIEICLSGYVFDSYICNLKSIFQLVDLFVIDAACDGQVCIEMKILNASKIIRR